MLLFAFMIGHTLGPVMSIVVSVAVVGGSWYLYSRKVSARREAANVGAGLIRE